MHTFLQDLRYGIRVLAKTPGFTAVAVLTLALGIGANTALFSIVNAVLLKPLPVPQPQQLALMVFDSENHKLPLASGYDGSAGTRYSSTGHMQGTSFPYITYQRLREEKETFSHVFAFAPIEQLTVLSGGRADIASGQYVTGDYFAGLGISAWRGRMLGEADDKAGAAPAAVISWGYWKRRFAMDAKTVGATVTINNTRFTIVGITPPEFGGTLELGQSADVTVPLQTEPLLEAVNPDLAKPAKWWLRIMGRLKEGVSLEQAQARMDAVFQKSVVDGFNMAAGENRNRAELQKHDYPHLLVVSGAQGDSLTRRRYRQPLGMLTIVVGMVLLIACINVANLLLARSAGRRQEFAMRIALGARHSRLVRQLLTESLLLSALAGAAGIVFAMWGKDLLLSWSSWMTGEVKLKAGLDARVLLFTLGISALTGVLFGLAPAFRAGDQRLASTMRMQGGTMGHTRTAAGKALIAAQVAISLVLLVASSLFVRTLHNLHSVDVGFSGDNLLLFRINPQTNGYTEATIGALYDGLIERLARIPGVRAVALSRHPLLSFSHRMDAIYLGESNQNNGEHVEINVVSPSFLATMRIPLLLGREFDARDTSTSQPAVIVNQAFARRYFANGNPIGQHFWLGRGGEGTGSPVRRPMTAAPNNRQLEIIGVARDAKYTDVRDDVLPTVYEPYAQTPIMQANFEIRYSGDAAALAPEVRDAIAQADERIPIFDVRTQTEQSEASLAEERMFANLSSSMGLLTLILAAVGLYGILSYAVRQRTAEIGVRMALGAQQRTVLAMVLRESLVMVGAGVAVGIPIAFAGARAAAGTLADLLYGIKAADPISFGAAAAMMMGVALLGAYLPAQRAASIDPMVALRHE